MQGVGFRPFVATLATRLGLGGWVRNESGVVRVLVEGTPEAIAAFAAGLLAEAPPLADVAAMDRRDVPTEGLDAFAIAPSVADGAGRPVVPPDVVMCDACAAEVADPADRRHRYPFTTCTDCGPRYSVIRAMPYDRARTTLAEFPLCAACRREYDTPGDRRFHAESIACPACGPRVWLEDRGTLLADGDDAIREAGRRLRLGQVLAVRGLGGFHLACDATNAAAVATLRARKRREAKPLAVMVASLAEAEAFADLTDAERRLLASRERPIVLVHARASAIPPGVAPGLARIGLMLAYTPLHLLLLEAACAPLVMTSGNLSDEPIAADLAEGRERLAPLADALLLHDREIAARIDDSVVRAAAGPTAPPILLRRARGFAPLPLASPLAATRTVLALGAHLKHTLAWAAGPDVWVSPHIGDLDTWETLAHAARLRDGLARLLGMRPACIAADLHAGYLSHRLADPWPDLPREVVQHHHAHVAAVMAEHRVVSPVLGIAYDGTGAGDDGTSWGAEFLACDLAGYRRVGHWLPVSLPGGDRASREGWRAAIGYAHASGGALAPRIGFADVAPEAVAQAVRQLEARVNAPVASSMGRLFDAVAALSGTRVVSAYEGQAAMELEALAERAAPWTGDPLWQWIETPGAPLVVSPAPLVERAAAWRREAADAAPGRAAAALHETVVAATVATAVRLCGALGLETVALGGGSWQNALLTGRVAAALAGAGLRVLTPRALPPNDGAIAYGQAVVAIARESSGNSR